MDTLATVLTIFATLLGFPALLTTIINVGKQFGWIKDGWADKIVFGANLLAFLGVGIAALTGNIEILGEIDVKLGAVAKLLAAFAVFATEMGMTRVYYSALRGVPVVGYSYSLEREKAISA